jgi:hypothetical protein
MVAQRGDGGAGEATLVEEIPQGFDRAMKEDRVTPDHKGVIKQKEQGLWLLHAASNHPPCLSAVQGQEKGEDGGGRGGIQASGGLLIAVNEAPLAQGLCHTQPP